MAFPVLTEYSKNLYSDQKWHTVPVTAQSSRSSPNTWTFHPAV